MIKMGHVLENLYWSINQHHLKINLHGFISWTFLSILEHRIRQIMILHEVEQRYKIPIIRYYYSWDKPKNYILYISKTNISSVTVEYYYQNARLYCQKCSKYLKVN
jgi:hypothetical protein